MQKTSVFSTRPCSRWRRANGRGEVGNCECILAIAAQNRSSPFGKRILQDGGDAAKAAGEGALTGRQRLHEKAREDGRGARMRRTLRHAVATALGARH